jgi:hypothetical protein
LGIWTAARAILSIRHLIAERDGVWRWNPDELMLRDYYANSLLTFEEVKRRGWPERKRDEKAVAAAKEAAAV